MIAVFIVLLCYAIGLYRDMFCKRRSCSICHGFGQSPFGTRCPVCEGRGSL